MAIYDVCLNIGHGTKSNGVYDPGAVCGNYQEHLIAKDICNNAAAKIKNKGINLHLGEQNYSNNILAGNTYKYKYAISVHLNAGGGTRAEIYCPCRDKNLDIEFYIMSELTKIGLKNGGVKSRDYNSEQTFIRTNGIALGYTDYYGEINKAYSQGVSLDILEVGFIDSSDRDIILKNIDKIGTIIANAFCMACDKQVYGLNESTSSSVNINNKFKESDYPMYLFSENWYLHRYSDVANAVKKGSFSSGYEHYIKNGKSEGRLPVPQIPSDYKEGDYLELNPDVKNAVEKGSYTSGMHHFMLYGFKESHRKINKSETNEQAIKRVAELEKEVESLRSKIKDIKDIVK